LSEFDLVEAKFETDCGTGANHSIEHGRNLFRFHSLAHRKSFRKVLVGVRFNRIELVGKPLNFRAFVALSHPAIERGFEIVVTDPAPRANDILNDLDEHGEIL
jgi:hypothetical protein